MLSHGKKDRDYAKREYAAYKEHNDKYYTYIILWYVVSIWLLGQAIGYPFATIAMLTLTFGGFRVFVNPHYRLQLPVLFVSIGIGLSAAPLALMELIGRL